MVIDASVWVAALLPGDVHHQEASCFLTQLVADGVSAAVPVLVLPEVAGAIARQTDDADLADKVLGFIRGQDWLRLGAVDHVLANSAAALAARQRLRGADAVYVALAARERATLITLDAQMLDRAPDGLGTLTPSAWLTRASGGRRQEAD